jgi:hypothetical protein
MNFCPRASFKIPTNDSGYIKDGLKNFWFQVDEFEDGLSSAIGCYIFSIRAGRGALPWYVGLAEKASFRKECFTSHKLVHYNKALNARNGTPMLTLLPKSTPGGGLVSPTGGEHRDIQLLEWKLIEKCLSRNNELCNISNTKLLKEMVVNGLMNTPQGKVSQAIADFKNLIG